MQSWAEFELGQPLPLSHADNCSTTRRSQLLVNGNISTVNIVNINNDLVKIKTINNHSTLARLD